MLKEKIKNNKFLAGSLLATFIAINVYPTGCFSWSTTKPTIAPRISVNKAEITKSLNCVLEKNDGEYTADEILDEIKSTTEPTFLITEDDFNYLKKNYSECNF